MKSFMIHRILFFALVPMLAFLMSGCSSVEREQVRQAPAPDFSAARGILTNAVTEGAFPGCVVAVGTADRVLWIEAFGHLDQEATAAVTADTVYDLASLSKVVGTTAVTMWLVEHRRLSLDDPVYRWVPEFAVGGEASGESGRQAVTVAHLLTHSSGLPSWKPLYKSVDSYREMIDAVCGAKLEAAPGERYKYSDLGLMLLGEVASRAGGKPLAELERRLVLTPLGMTSTLRNPSASMWNAIAPTELDPATGKVIRGVVHDENARAAEGVTGHAGLFSTAGDLSLYAQELLNALHGKGKVFSRAVVEQFARRHPWVAESHRGLGWQMASGGNSAGGVLSASSFGHTGFTGTSIWIDPERGIFVILLGNRVHPTRNNSKHVAVRSGLADAVARAFDEARASF